MKSTLYEDRNLSSQRTLSEEWRYEDGVYRHYTGARLVDNPAHDATYVGTARPWMVMVDDDTPMVDGKGKVRRFSDPDKAMQAFNISKHNYLLSELTDLLVEVIEYLPGTWEIVEPKKAGFVRSARITDNDWTLRFDLRQDNGHISVDGRDDLAAIAVSITAIPRLIADGIRKAYQIGEQIDLL